MKTKLISLLVIMAVLSVCALPVAAAHQTPKLVGDSSTIHISSTSTSLYGSIYVSGYVANDYGHGIGGLYGYLTSNGYVIPNSGFYTNSDGTWGGWITFTTYGPHYIEVHCDGMTVGLNVEVY